MKKNNFLKKILILILILVLVLSLSSCNPVDRSDEYKTIYTSVNKGVYDGAKYRLKVETRDVRLNIFSFVIHEYYVAIDVYEAGKKEKVCRKVFSNHALSEKNSREIIEADNDVAFLYGEIRAMADAETRIFILTAINDLGLDISEKANNEIISKMEKNAPEALYKVVADYGDSIRPELLDAIKEFVPVLEQFQEPPGGKGILENIFEWIANLFPISVDIKEALEDSMEEPTASILANIFGENFEDFYKSFGAINENALSTISDHSIINYKEFLRTKTDEVADKIMKLND